MRPRPIVCEYCGKRCPHAERCDLPCTSSNEATKGPGMNAEQIAEQRITHVGIPMPGGWAYTQRLPPQTASESPLQPEEQVILHLLSEVERLTHALTARDQRIAELEGAWQPIETAPKDGTHFLAVWSDHDECHVVYIRDGKCHREMDDDDWMMPTHWMPLLPPPTASSPRG